MIRKKGRENPNFKDRTGERYITNEGYEVEIIEYKGNRDYTIRFTYNGVCIKRKSFSDLLTGEIKNPYHPSVYGVGYLGVGKYTPKIDKKFTLAYSTWRSLIERSSSCKFKSKHPSYKNVTVCEEWCDFQNFAAWHENNYNPETMQGWQLDKDLLSKEKKEYSPENCAFVPQKINKQIRDRTNIIGKYCKGVFKAGKKFVATVHGSKRTSNYVGIYDTIEEASEAHIRETKIKFIELAEEYKNRIDPRIYNKLVNYS